MKSAIEWRKRCAIDSRGNNKNENDCVKELMNCYK